MRLFLAHADQEFIFARPRVPGLRGLWGASLQRDARNEQITDGNCGYLAVAPYTNIPACARLAGQWVPC